MNEKIEEYESDVRVHKFDDKPPMLLKVEKKK
jgi:hypothetical protein